MRILPRDEKFYDLFTELAKRLTGSASILQELFQNPGQLDSKVTAIKELPMGTNSKLHVQFNDRFWYAEGGYLYDVIDGPDGDSKECRPNQLFSISLPNAVLDRARWEPVVDVVHDRLLTPVGLRSLAPGSREYRSNYFGNLRERDAAYHQGTVWGWLIGPWVDAWLRVNPGRREEARGFLGGLVAHLDEFGVGSIAEIFDAEEPYTPRGCIAQAWSVAELLRCWALTT